MSKGIGKDMARAYSVLVGQSAAKRGVSPPFAWKDLGELEQEALAVAMFSLLGVLADDGVNADWRNYWRREAANPHG